MMAASAVASFVNVLSSAIMWVLPAYAGLLIAKADDRIDRLPWRRNLTVQILAIAALGTMFLIDRLPAIYSSSQQYGSPFASAAQAMAGLRELGATLFPSFVWAALAAIGVIGLAASSRHPIGRLFARIAVVIAITDCLYILYSARLPFPRVMFQFIPLVLIGIAWAIEDVVGRSIGARGKVSWRRSDDQTVAIVLAATVERRVC
jgi:hypothetical protein